MLFVLKPSAGLTLLTSVDALTIVVCLHCRGPASHYARHVNLNQGMAFNQHTTQST
jgi:hypothetical protein